MKVTFKDLLETSQERAERNKVMIERTKKIIADRKILLESNNIHIEKIKKELYENK